MTPHAQTLHLHADAQVVAQRLPSHDAAPGTDPTSATWLHAMARTLAQTPMAADKAGRWMGYIHGVGTARGWWRSQWCAPSSHQGFAEAPTGDPDVSAHHAVLRDLAARLPLAPARTPRDEDAWPMEARAGHVEALIARALDLRALHPLAAITGLVQGIAAARGWIDVAEERLRTRPIFHAAAQAAGRGTPATVAAMEAAPHPTSKTPTAPIDLHAVRASMPRLSPRKVDAGRPAAPRTESTTTPKPTRNKAPAGGQEAPAFPFVLVDRVAKAWATSPSQVMAWIGLDLEEAMSLAPPARAEADARLDGALRLAEVQQALGWSLDWRGFLATPVPGHAGHSWAGVLDAYGPDAAIAASRSIAAGVHA